MNSDAATEPEYDVALSFAGEQRQYVESVAAALRDLGVRPFYDDYEKVALWGKDLYEHLDWVYQRAARYCVMFVSEDYARKVWTTHERRSAQARALQSSTEYVLPARFDSTEVPGLRSTVGYVDLQSMSPVDLASLIVQKLGPSVRKNYFPPTPDRLYRKLGARKKKDKEAVDLLARDFLQAQFRMTSDERVLIGHIFVIDGCGSQLPDNVHVSLDLLRRRLGHPPSETLDMLSNMRSIGFEHEVRDDDDHGDDVVVVRWPGTHGYDGEAIESWSMERFTEVAVEMMRVAAPEDGCLQCTIDGFRNVDFANLSSLMPTAPHDSGQ